MSHCASGSQASFQAEPVGSRPSLQSHNVCAIFPGKQKHNVYPLPPHSIPFMLLLLNIYKPNHLSATRSNQSDT